MKLYLQKDTRQKNTALMGSRVLIFVKVILHRLLLISSLWIIKKFTNLSLTRKELEPKCSLSLAHLTELRSQDKLPEKTIELQINRVLATYLSPAHACPRLTKDATPKVRSLQNSRRMRRYVLRRIFLIGIRSMTRAGVPKQRNT